MNTVFLSYYRETFEWYGVIRERMDVIEKNPRNRLAYSVTNFVSLTERFDLILIEKYWF